MIRVMTYVVDWVLKANYPSSRKSVSMVPESTMVVGFFPFPGLPYALVHVLNSVKECKNLPKTLTIYNHDAPSHAEASVNRNGKIIWLAFAFESVSSVYVCGGVSV